MYHELVYHLDLCILSYHLYTQTLIWPMDPYYEQMARKGTSRRDNFMAKVRATPPRDGYNCPEHLDPIVGDYSRIFPWRACFVKPEPRAPWLVFQAPNQITDPIRDTNSSITGIRIQSTGDNQPHNNMPPYYALCYIMKL